MNDDLLHQAVEKVSLVGVRPRGHDLVEVVDQSSQHLLVDRRQFYILLPRFKRLLCAGQLIEPSTR
ncbi:hypothetical protein FJ251_04455 [bacterium]|nr:hypothetical protein [bacterium]